MITGIIIIVAFFWIIKKLNKQAREDRAFRKALIERTITRQAAQRHLDKHPFLYPPMVAIKFNQQIAYLEDETHE